jgi:hypothetical protein
MSSRHAGLLEGMPICHSALQPIAMFSVTGSALVSGCPKFNRTTPKEHACIAEGTQIDPVQLSRLCSEACAEAS